MVYQIKNAVIGYPGNRLLEGISIEIKNTEKIAIVGRNGCGKTTLLKVIAGKLEVDNLDSDEEFLVQADGNPRIGYLEQVSFEEENITVREEFYKVYEKVFYLRERMNELTKQMEQGGDDKLLEQYAKASEQFESLGGYSYQYELEQIFTKFGFDLLDLDRQIATFSGGQKTRIAFVKLLLSKPDIMLLDEPTNHLDMVTIEWLEGYLKKYNHAVVIVSHDRMFLDKVVEVTYEIEHKKMKRYPGNYSAFVERKRLDYEKHCKDYEAQQKEIERLTIFIEKWKNTPTKVAMTRSKQMQIEHMVKIPKPLRFDTKAMHANLLPERESGKEVLTVKGLEIGYQEVLANVSFQLRKGKKLAVLGENGKGKSTLLKTIVGQKKELGGTYQFGKDVDVVYFDQELLNLNETKTVIEEFWDTYPKLTQTEVRTRLGNFLFTGEDVFSPLSQLSGGEKVRLSLAKLMNLKANFMILDEPTNHLDMIGKEMLQTMLKEYEGTLFMVSHDRYFVKEVADCLLIFEQGKVTYYPYGYEEYQEKKSRTLDGETSNGKGSKELNHFVGLGDSQESSKSFCYGRDKAKIERRLAKLESEITIVEDRIHQFKQQFSNPSIATDYQKLDEIQNYLEEEEERLNELLLEWTGLIS